jgi:protein tyrosine phosphatase (PTP) superfamily phosphohydrolase (DUF442 family)
MLRELIRQRLPAVALRRPRARTLARLTVLVGVLVVGLEAAHVLVGTNRHEILPGRVYRSNQPTPDSLRAFITSRGIKTVINLRGHCPGEHTPWYKEEIRVTSELGVSHEDITFSANRLPAPTELKRLIEVLDHTEYPILFHCKQGADRTGLTATIVMLLYTDASLARARRQLWPRYGHIRFGRTAAMDDFFDRYESWLAGRAHTPALFREWATTHYSPGPASGTMTAQHGTESFRVNAADWAAIRVIATNTSTEPWEMRPEHYAGVHVEFNVYNQAGQKVTKGMAGLLHRTVAPGESIPLTLAVPPLRTPGTYILHADLMNGTGAAVPIRQTGFYQFGADPLTVVIQAQ